MNSAASSLAVRAWTALADRSPLFLRAEPALLTEHAAAITAPFPGPEAIDAHLQRQVAAASRPSDEARAA